MKIISAIRTAVMKRKNLYDARKIFQDTMLTHSTREEKLRVLKTHLGIIAFECFSYCNRKCWFCGNAKIDRHSFCHYLPEETFLRVCDTLAEIDYSGNVSWACYNEPLAKTEVALERIRQARERLPNAFFFLFTNSDFLTKELMYELDMAGINFLAPQCYYALGEPYDLEKNVKPSVENMLKKLGISPWRTEERWDFHSLGRLYIMPTERKMLVYTMCSNFDAIGLNRGDTTDAFNIFQNRMEPCSMPLYRLHINYTGLVMPCCEFRCDAEINKHHAIGDANIQSIEDIFCCEKAVRFRNDVMRYGTKPSPCNHCGGGLEVDFTKVSCLNAYTHFFHLQEAARRG
ncbi:MAG: SPASM domain-containing protein [Desulfovibrio sp.]|nr:SPASM domain-containing protein [Desulfovibrio sp.]